MTKIYRTAEGGSPEAGGLVQVCGLAVDKHGAQAGMVHDYFPPLRAHGRIEPASIATTHAIGGRIMTFAEFCCISHGRDY
jgi:hypothetical protein